LTLEQYRSGEGSEDQRNAFLRKTYWTDDATQESKRAGDEHFERVSKLAAKGAEATTIYGKKEREEWIKINDTLDQKQAAAGRARIIAARRRLPVAAVETIRRLIPARQK